jgi:hypothetical protein
MTLEEIQEFLFLYRENVLARFEPLAKCRSGCTLSFS